MWNKNNLAYIQNFSTIHALIDIFEHWTTNIDDQYQNINMFLGLSATFDCIKHTTLIQKMRIYNFGDCSMKLIDSYSSYRSQLVAVGGKESEFLWNKHGVPKG